MNSGDEYDALTRGGPKVHKFRSRRRKRVKRKFRRRERAELSSSIDAANIYAAITESFLRE
jgi:hypothetical protein